MAEVLTRALAHDFQWRSAALCRPTHPENALDVELPDLERPTKARLLNAMKGHVLAESQLIGTYQMVR
jgi:hypothetical protein